MRLAGAGPASSAATGAPPARGATPARPATARRRRSPARGLDRAPSPLQARASACSHTGRMPSSIGQVAAGRPASRCAGRAALARRPGGVSARAVGQRQRRARVEAGLRRQQPRQVAHVRAIGPSVDSWLTHRSAAASAARGPGWGAGRRRGSSRRVAQRAHEVRAVGHRQQALRQRHRRAAAAAAGADRRVPGVAVAPNSVVVGVRAEAELGHVGLADDDAAGRLHARRRSAVLRRRRRPSAAASRRWWESRRRGPCP
jgi:hypothetical protein